MTAELHPSLTDRIGSMLTDPQLEISDDLRSTLTGLQQTQNYGKGEYVYREGHPCLGVYVVHSGTIKLIIDGFPEEQCSACTVRKDTVLGMAAALGEQPHSASAVCLSDCEIGFIPMKPLLRLLRSDTSISLDLSMKLAAGINRAHEQVVKMRTSVRRDH